MDTSKCNKSGCRTLFNCLSNMDKSNANKSCCRNKSTVSSNMDKSKSNKSCCRTLVNDVVKHEQFQLELSQGTSQPCRPTWTRPKPIRAVTGPYSTVSSDTEKSKSNTNRWRTQDTNMDMAKPIRKCYRT